MDRSLEEIINERPRGGSNRSRGGPRRGEGRRPPPREYDAPRDGVRKQYGPRDGQRDSSRNIDRDWVHDKYDDDESRRGAPRDRYPRDEYPRESQAGADAKLRVDNIHYDLSEKDLKELFTRIGDIASARMTYDRHDRPTGTAFVTYYSLRDARDAVREFDGANAYGQPIRVTLLPPGPAPGARPRNPFDNVEKPSRSLFERIEHDSAPRSRRRSNSPARDGVDRYVPGRNRSPISRRGTPREGGRRPGARRENSGRPARGGARGGGEGRPGARPKKTAEELDAEMNDYWGGGAGQGDAAAVAADASTAREPQVKTVENGENPGQAAPAPINESDDIDLMVE